MGTRGNSNPETEYSTKLPPLGFGGSTPPGGGGPPDNRGKPSNDNWPKPDNDNLPPHIIRIALANFKEDASKAVIGRLNPQEGKSYLEVAREENASHFFIGDVAWRALDGENAYQREQANFLALNKFQEAKLDIQISTPPGQGRKGGMLALEIDHLKAGGFYRESEDGNLVYDEKSKE